MATTAWPLPHEHDDLAVACCVTRLEQHTTMPDTLRTHGKLLLRPVSNFKGSEEHKMLERCHFILKRRLGKLRLSGGMSAFDNL
jgi:hypothetical protein